MNNQSILTNISKKYSSLFEGKLSVLGDIAKDISKSNIADDVVKGVGNVIKKEKSAVDDVIKGDAKAGSKVEKKPTTGKIKKAAGGAAGAYGVYNMAKSAVDALLPDGKGSGASKGDGDSLNSRSDRNWPTDFPGEEVFTDAQRAVIDGTAFFLIPEESTEGLYSFLLKAIEIEADVVVAEDEEDAEDIDNASPDIELVKERFDEVSQYWELVLEYGFDVAFDKRKEDASEEDNSEEDGEPEADNEDETPEADETEETK